ncbi:MAG TPA: glycine betaine ABC transporter substrate-binding protein [Clostridia bacterium]|nr:glycine betaine ABC transporter substrate-binding protein [Clostridia bacterium]
MVLLIGGLFVGCDQQTDNNVTIGYVAWDSEIASTNVLKQVFERAGYDVEITAVDAGPLFQGMADGQFDCTCSAWLPYTHKNFMTEYGDQIVEVRENLVGAKIGLVVPDYVTINSIEEMNDVADNFNNEITGIEAGAGVMQATEDTIEVYDLDYDLVASSSAGMAAALGKAIDEDKWIAVTGWSPHWKFARWDLKYLDDPEGTFGGEEYIATIARNNLEEEKPEVYELLTKFNWTPDDMHSVMLDIADGMSEEDAASKWVEANIDQVNEWIGQ